MVQAALTPLDHCVITASDEHQAAAFRALLQRRLDHGLYPREIAFHVYPDPPGRVGSGAGTLWALHRLYTDLGISPGRDLNSVEAPSVLVLHAAGESRRLPVFAPEGKLFAPIPSPSSSVVQPVVLDLQLSLYLRFPWEPGMAVVGSGDVIIDFDTQSLAPLTAPITGFAAPAPLEQGSRHGVFAFDPDFRRVVGYHQKQPVSVLRESARMEGTQHCALDIGIVAMRADYQQALFSLAGRTDGGGRTLLERVEQGEARFGLYLEQLLASLPAQSEAAYRNAVADVSTLTPEDQQAFYRLLHPFPLGGQLTRDCTFLHFGSVAEYPVAARELAGSRLRPFYSSFDSDELYVEPPAATAIVEGIDWPNELSVPEGFCVDCRTIAGQHYVAVYHAQDSFRTEPADTARFCGQPLTQWLSERGLSLPDIGGGDSLAVAELPVFTATEDLGFIEGYYRPPRDPERWRESFVAAAKVSVQWLNSQSDAVERDAERMRLRTRRLASQVSSGQGWRTISGADLRAAIRAGLSISTLQTELDATADRFLASYRETTFRHATGSGIPRGRHSRAIRFLEPGRWQASKRSIKPDQIVWARAPVRLDLGGGWSDTPPYTNLLGGAVTNVAANLNGQPPIQVFVRPATEHAILFHSIDLGVREVVSNERDLAAYTNPGHGFALPRAACSLLGLGTTPLEQTLRALGGGFEVSLLAAVPKGSGLGTSSILGGVILAALLRYFGITYTLDDLFLGVLELEQMLTTGGGWQDQIGGLAGGVKYVESAPGLHPQPLVHQLDPHLFEHPDFVQLLTLYYTGTTRLAKNILQDVVDRVNLREPAYLFTHRTLVSLAKRARRAIELRDYPSLCRVVAGSWQANKRIHHSTSNEEIEALLADASPYSAGAKLLGAGGGGFALFLSRSAEDADRLRNQLARRSAESELARLVEFSLSRQGLEVSVS